MRAIAIAVLITSLGCAAVAQNLDGEAKPDSQNDAKQTVQAVAPVGHRQPTQGDLTPRVRKDETTGMGAEDPLGPLPRICRAC